MIKKKIAKTPVKNLGFNTTLDGVAKIAINQGELESKGKRVPDWVHPENPKAESADWTTPKAVTQPNAKAPELKHIADPNMGNASDKDSIPSAAPVNQP